MNIGLAADHGGFELKETIRCWLCESGYQVVDYGAAALDPADDFPDFVIPLARDVAAGKLSRGIAICGSGVGACIAANKVPGVRAALIHEIFSARQGVEDDDMNVLCLGGQTLGPALARELITAFLQAQFRGEERHRRRLEKIAVLEDRPPTG